MCVGPENSLNITYVKQELKIYEYSEWMFASNPSLWRQKAETRNQILKKT